MDFLDALAVVATGDPESRRKSIWSLPGVRPFDARLNAVADLYRRVSEAQRQQMREAVTYESSWDLIAYVRRVAQCIQGSDDAGWLRRGLDIAAIENGRYDFRDSIVSMVVLRHGAERCGIDPGPYFEESIALAQETFRRELKNARDHRDTDVRFTVNEFGPPAWGKKRRRG